MVINFENVKEGYDSAFMTYVELGYPGLDLGAYDFGSIMHYPGHAFSVNDQPTIVRRDNGQPVKAQRNALSNGDIAAIRTIYGDISSSIAPDGKICGGAGRYSPPSVPAGTTS